MIEGTEKEKARNKKQETQKQMKNKKQMRRGLLR